MQAIRHVNVSPCVWVIRVAASSTAFRWRKALPRPSDRFSRVSISELCRAAWRSPTTGSFLRSKLRVVRRYSILGYVPRTSLYEIARRERGRVNLGALHLTLFLISQSSSLGGMVFDPDPEPSKPEVASARTLRLAGSPRRGTGERL